MKEFFPVCNPNLNDGRLPRDLASLLSEPLLIDRNLSWRAWFKSVGMKLDCDIVGTSFTGTNALMEAAVAGQGIALGRPSVTRSDIPGEGSFACLTTACALPTATMPFT